MLEPGDTLVVSKLDRFSRTSLEGMTLMQDLLQRDIGVKILNFGESKEVSILKIN